jgi:hypothetical protein
MLPAATAQVVAATPGLRKPSGMCMETQLSRTLYGMTNSKATVGSRFRGVVACMTAVAMTLATLALSPASAAETATFEGTVLAPDNTPAQGFTVVFKETTGGQTFKSLATGPSGEYKATVQVGGVYKLDSVIGPDGKKLPVQSIDPIPVKEAGTNRLVVKFTNLAPPAATATTAAAASPSGAQHTAKAGPPWWHTAGGITGIVLGTVVVVGAGIGFSQSGSSPAPEASPFAPPAQP